MGRTSDARERLVDTGSELMHERGYTAVGVSEVCDKAGVNKGSFYHFFPSKQELALAVVERFADSVETRLRELVEGDGPAVERIERFFADSCEGQKRMRAECGKVLGCPLGNLALEMSTQDAVLREKLRAVFDRQVAAFAAVIRQAVERGEIRGPVDPDRSARAVVSLAEGATMLAKTHDDPSLVEDVGSQVFQLLGIDR